MILVHYYQLNIFNIVLIFIGNKQLVDKQLLVKSYTDKFQDVYESDQNKLSKGSNALELKKLVKVIPNKLILDLTNAKLIMSLDSVQDHPNLNKLFKVLKIQKRLYYYGVDILCIGGDLLNKQVEKDKFREKRQNKYFYKSLQPFITAMLRRYIIETLNQNIFYSQIKPNYTIKLIGKETQVFFNDNQYKTFDWKIKIKSKAQIVCLIIQLSEVLNGKYDELCDFWPAEVILHILLTDTPPFNGTSESEILKAVKYDKNRLDIPEFQMAVKI